MFRHFKGGRPPTEEESSDEEDFFSNHNATKPPIDTQISQQLSGRVESNLPVSTTSSMKRHHGAISDARKAKMDALLVELQQTETKKVKKTASVPPPPARGSYVQPGEEHITTNLFVGNLSPSITEEQLRDLFVQFGELYSVKIMWARTPEARARNRHSGFVCFMHRKDAEDAIQSLDETDPFSVGRRIMVRWGKHVKKTTQPRVEVATTTTTTKSAVSEQVLRERQQIRVAVPMDVLQRRVIDTIASYVAVDGEQLESQLRHSEDPHLYFLRDKESPEYVYFKWRVYSFARGDGVHTWRTEPFVMVEPGGAVWIPPPINQEAALAERQEKERQQRIVEQQKNQRRIRQDGRKVDHGRIQLTSSELADFDRLFRTDLSSARGSVCEAMAFCFERSGAYEQICSMMKESLMVDLNNIVASSDDVNMQVDKKIAQLYVLSDVLHNSQQPGVRNAFRYRDSIEKMAPEIFKSLGEQMRTLGRMTGNRISMAVKSVVGAWTNWSVYSPPFLDELISRFEGNPIVEISAEDTAREIRRSPSGKDVETKNLSETIEDTPRNLSPTGQVFKPTSVADVKVDSKMRAAEGFAENEGETDAEGDPLEEDPDGEPLEDGADGEPLEDDADGEPLEDADGEPLEDGADGEPLEDVDGEPLDCNDTDGEVFEAHGEPVGDPAVANH